MSEQETTQKVLTKYDRKMQKRKEEELKAKKRARIDKIVSFAILAVIVLALAAIPVSRHIATHSTYITVGEHELTKAEFDYYYSMAKTDYLNTYGRYLSMMGVNVNGDMESQSYDGNMSWKDYFDMLAADRIKQTKALVDAAKAAGFEYDASEDVAFFNETAKAAAKEAGESLAKYYKMTFGKYATTANLKQCIEEGYIASAYYEQVADSKAASEADIKAYYEENTASYDSVDFRLTEIEAEIPEAETVSDGDGEKTVEPTEEEIQAAMDAAKEKADAALEAIVKDGELKEGMLKSVIPAKYSDWLYDEARVEGDTTVIEDTDNHKYYVVRFEKRYLDETATANIRAIMTTEDGEKLLAEWTANGGTEEAFAALAEKYSVDAYTNRKGGLYEELAPSTLDSFMSDWIFDEARKAGDTTVLTEEGANYVLYYVADGRPEWQTKIAETLLGEKMSEYLEEIKAPYEVADPKGHLTYLKLQAAKEEADKNAESTENTENTESTDAAEE